jgi:hypothetical protein
MGKDEEEKGDDVESFDESEEMDDLLVTFEDEEGNEVDFMVLAVMEIDGQDYAMLAPVEQLGDDESDEGIELYYFKYTEADGEETYDEIEDEALLERVHKAFGELMEQADEGEE